MRGMSNYVTQKFKGSYLVTMHLSEIISLVNKALCHDK